MELKDLFGWPDWRVNRQLIPGLIACLCLLVPIAATVIAILTFTSPR